MERELRTDGSEGTEIQSEEKGIEAPPLVGSLSLKRNERKALLSPARLH
jgi:hypothetical protein